MRAPVLEQRAVFHLSKMSVFSDIPSGSQGYYGVLGTHRELSVEEVYHVSHVNSDRTVMHMQHDTIHTDFGYMTSHGYDG